MIYRQNPWFTVSTLTIGFPRIDTTLTLHSYGKQAVAIGGVRMSEVLIKFVDGVLRP